MQALQVIEMLAGTDGQGQPVIEKLQVKIDKQDQCTLVKSPAFVKGIASGDVIKLNNDTKQFEIVRRAGNLCIRVLSRGDIGAVADRITPALEKLGGQLDTETPRMLVYSIHVSCGFNTIEELLNRNMDDDTVWLYGNVYDPNDGTTPLNWWNAILKPE